MYETQHIKCTAEQSDTTQNTVTLTPRTNEMSKKVGGVSMSLSVSILHMVLLLLSPIIGSFNSRGWTTSRTMLLTSLSYLAHRHSVLPGNVTSNCTCYRDEYLPDEKDFLTYNRHCHCLFLYKVKTAPMVLTMVIINEPLH